MIDLSPSGKIPDGNYNPSGSCSSYTSPAYSCDSSSPGGSPGIGDDNLAGIFHSFLMIVIGFIAFFFLWSTLYEFILFLIRILERTNLISC